MWQLQIQNTNKSVHDFPLSRLWNIYCKLMRCLNDWLIIVSLALYLVLSKSDSTFCLTWLCKKSLVIRESTCLSKKECSVLSCGFLIDLRVLLRRLHGKGWVLRQQLGLHLHQKDPVRLLLVPTHPHRHVSSLSHSQPRQGKERFGRIILHWMMIISYSRDNKKRQAIALCVSKHDLRLCDDL